MDESSTSKQGWINFVALLGLAVAVVWFCEDIIFRGHVPFFRDLATYSYPLKYSLAKSFNEGEIGLWDRHMAAGFPILAAFQAGAFYPPNVAFYLLSFFDALRCIFLLHFLIAATGAYCLCRRWKSPPYLSMVAAILFAFGGTTVSLTNLLNHFQTTVWLPWMVLCWEHLLDERSWKTFSLLTIVLLNGLLAGSPEVYVFSLGILVLDGFRLSARGQGLTVIRMTFLLVIVNLIVVALGMIQFLPTFELLLESRRGGLIPFNEASYWSLRPMSLLGLIFPDKEVDGNSPLGMRLFFAPEAPFLLSHYIGVLSMLGVCAWFYHASWRERVLNLSVIAASLVLALGSLSPVYTFLFEHVAAFRSIRFPEKFFFLTFVFVLFVVLRGLAALHDAKHAHRHFAAAVLLSLLFLWGGVYSFLRLQPEVLYAQLTHWSQTDSGASSASAVLFNLERQIAVTAALFIVYFCGSIEILGNTLKHGLVTVIVLLDIVTANKPLKLALDSEAVTSNKPVLQQPDLSRNRLFYYPSGANLHPSSLLVGGRPSFEKTVALSFDNLLPNAGVLYGFDYFQEIDALARQPYTDFLDFANRLPPEKRIKIFRSLNIRYVVAFQPLEIQGLRLVGRFPEHFSWLYEVDQPVPRSYIASTIINETQTGRILELMSSAEFDPAQQVILMEPVAQDSNRSTAGKTRIVQYTNTNVVIEALLNAPGILVLTDSYYPGWKVFVDGQESSILRANHFFRGVRLTPGTHRIEFKYQPLSFTIGASISFLTLIVLSGISIVRYFAWRKSRRQLMPSLPLAQPIAAEQ